MARPQKEGLIYFPLDVDMADDDKVILIQARHGIAGFGILIRLLMELYKNSYYYAWTEREQLIFSNRIGVNIATVKEVINDALKWGFFHQKLYEEYEILTSRGIQKRYLEGTAKRKEVCLAKEYMLIDIPKRNNIIISTLTRVSSGNNSVNDGSYQQSKVHESKVNNNTPPIIPPKGERDDATAATEDNAISGESLLVETATGEPNKVSHSTTQKRTRKTLTLIQKARFNRFWTVWPYKVSRGQAEETWGKLDPDDDLTGKIIEGVRRAIKYDRRFQPGGFMPHASTWLNANGWEDEYSQQGGIAANGGTYANKSNNAEQHIETEPNSRFRKFKLPDAKL